MEHHLHLQVEGEEEEHLHLSEVEVVEGAHLHCMEKVGEAELLHKKEVVEVEEDHLHFLERVGEVEMGMRLRLSMCKGLICIFCWPTSFLSSVKPSPAVIRSFLVCMLSLVGEPN